MIAQENREDAEQIVEYYQTLVAQVETEVQPSEPGPSSVPERITSTKHLELLSNVKKEETWKKRDIMLKKKIQAHKDRQAKILQEEMDRQAALSRQDRAKNKSQPSIPTKADLRRQEIEQQRKEKQEEIQRMVEETKQREQQRKSHERMQAQKSQAKL